MNYGPYGGGRPVGNPAALLAAARELLGIASNLDGLDAQIARALPRSAFRGPARGGIDGELRNAALQTMKTGDDLLALAKTLSDGAATLKRRQRAWDVAERERRAELARAKDRCPT